jgi:LPS-assembly protein
MAAPEGTPPAAAVAEAVPPAPAPSVPAPAVAANRISFELRFPAERGGGTATGTAGAIEYVREDEAVASGGVDLRYQDSHFAADRVAVNLSTKQLTAEGNVIFDQGPRRLAGATLVFDLEAKTGSLTAASAFVNPDYHFKGAEIAKTGENSYTVRDGTFTSCEGVSPPWSFRVSFARVEVEGYAHVKNARMQIKGVPVFYLPYLLWPVKQDRSSGLLVPNIGYSRQRGSYLGFAYFQELGRSFDTTLFAEIHGREYYGLGNEFRYRPSENVRGIFRGYVIDDPFRDEKRWKISYDHEHNDLPGGMRGVVSYRDYSDFEFFRDFERDLSESTLRTVYSSAFVTGNWGPQSLNILIDDRSTLVDASKISTETGRVVIQRQLPEIEYRLRPTKIGRTPLYLQLLSSVNYVSVERSETVSGDYGRVDLFPQLVLPLRAWPWLSLSLKAGGRATWYGDSVTAGQQGFTGEQVTRIYPTAGVQMIGPSLSRLFETKDAKVKHVIEPRVDYDFLGDFDEVSEIPLFDEVDTQRPASLARFSLVQRFLVKPNAAGALNSAREILSFEVAQPYSFETDRPLQRSGNGLQTEAWGPLSMLLRFQPSATTNVKAEATYNTLFGGIEATALTGQLALGRGNDVGLTWYTRRNVENDVTTSDQFALSTNLGLGKRLRLSGRVNWDLEREVLQQSRISLAYAAQCYGFQLEYREFRVDLRRDREWRFMLNLKNVGSFLDLNGGRSSELR